MLVTDFLKWSNKWFSSYIGSSLNIFEGIGTLWEIHFAFFPKLDEKIDNT